MIEFESQRQKAYVWTGAPSEDSYQLFLHADAQADLSLRWTHMSEGMFRFHVFKLDKSSNRPILFSGKSYQM